MIVEDEPLIRLVVADELREAGVDVVEAATAEEALRYIEAGAQFHLVFTDVDMPGPMDGLGLARHLSKTHPAVPVIITSGKPYASEIEAQWLFIPKPYSVAGLIDMFSEKFGIGPRKSNE